MCVRVIYHGSFVCASYSHLDSCSHCPWVGNCIGERNHCYFFYFLITTSLLTILVTALCIRLLVLQFERTEYTPSPQDALPPQLHKLGMSIMSMPIVVIFGVFALLCAWSLTSLMLFHGLIISLAQTTNERVRNVFQHHANRDNQGCLENWTSALCGKRSASLLPNDFSEMVTCQYCAPETVWSGVETEEAEEVEEESRPESPIFHDELPVNGGHAAVVLGDATDNV